MNMLAAIALSATNKASTIRQTRMESATIIVQQRYGEIGLWWFHVWEVENRNGTPYYLEYEDDIGYGAANSLIRERFEVDPLNPNWIPL